jgi:polyhydroxyalkanoate synthesis regulator phasin
VGGTEPVTRNADGTFPTGVSGNPNGRPKGSKNEIVALKHDLEIAVRKHLTADKVAKIIDKMVALAESGNVGAAKLILDKVVSNARDSDEADDNNRGGIRIVIQNATFAHKRETPVAVEAEFTEVKQ